MSILSELNIKGFSSATARWSKFGPYYAMFPIDFAFEVVERYSQRGEYVLDPFAGRCSSVYAAAVMGRHSLGIEINPIGWLYGSVKLAPAPKSGVLERLLEVYNRRYEYIDATRNLPVFYHHCYCTEVLSFLLAVRSNLNWQKDSVDASLMANILVYLHGKRGQSLSNQMPIAKSTGQIYSVNWWNSKNLSTPPELDPFDFLKRKIEWRYAKGIPSGQYGKVICGDSTIELEKLSANSSRESIKYSLLFTSPPYWSVTNYHKDQWLRLWLLGKSATPMLEHGEYRGRFRSKEKYLKLLQTVFKYSSRLMAPQSTIYVRTDKREYTLNSTLNILKKCFPDHDLNIVSKPVSKRTQTDITGNRSNSKGEVDLILSN